MSIRLCDVSYCHPNSSQPILERVSVEFKPATVTCIVGRSGIGKTTLANLISKTIAPTQGVVENTLPTGHMFQKCGLFPWKRVDENLLLAAKKNPSLTSKKDEINAVRSMLGEIGLKQRSQHFPRELSGGEAQRVAIAQNLLLGKRLLVLDEPFSALDQVTKAEVHTLLEQLRQEQNLSIIYISHNLEDVATIADEVLVMTGPDGKQWKHEQIRNKQPFRVNQTLPRMSYRNTSFQRIARALQTTSMGRTL